MAICAVLLQSVGGGSSFYDLLWAAVFGFAALNILGLVARRFEPGRSSMTFGEMLASRGDDRADESLSPQAPPLCGMIPRDGEEIQLRCNLSVLRCANEGGSGKSGDHFSRRSG